MKRYLLPLAAIVMISVAGFGWAQHGQHGAGPTDEKALLKMVREMLPSPKDSPSTRAFKERISK